MYQLRATEHDHKFRDHSECGFSRPLCFRRLPAPTAPPIDPPASRRSRTSSSSSVSCFIPLILHPLMVARHRPHSWFIPGILFNSAHPHICILLVTHRSQHHRFLIARVYKSVSLYHNVPSNPVLPPYHIIPVSILLCAPLRLSSRSDALKNAGLPPSILSDIHPSARAKQHQNPSCPFLTYRLRL